MFRKSEEIHVEDLPLLSFRTVRSSKEAGDKTCDVKTVEARTYSRHGVSETFIVRSDPF